MSQAELEHLLRVLGDRDTDLSGDDVAWAFESPETKEDISEWVREYLSPATLLTREELHLYGISRFRIPLKHALRRRTNIFQLRI